MGRLKRFIKLGGEMISMPAIEEVLNKKYQNENDEGPVIAVETLTDEENPEIILFTTLNISREEINSVIRESGLSALHNIRKVIKIDEIPVLGTGKTNYRELKQRL
jgi:long-chain-fatty-acid--[acyl-carrier-protein] ligase